jgi:hypothetical protein
MKSCKPSCITAMTKIDWSQECKEQHKSGGIPYLLFMKVDPAYVHPFPGGWDNIANIEAALCAEQLVYSPKVLGQSAGMSTDEKKFNSCDPAEAINGKQSIEFESFRYTEDLSSSVVKWYNDMKNNQDCYYFGYVDCNDDFYQVPSNWAMKVAEKHDQTSEGNKFIAGSVTFYSEDMIEFVNVPGLNALLDSFDASAGCSYGI